MSATEEVRARLDAMGVEWVGTDYTEPTNGHATNTSLGHEHHDAVFAEYVDGTVLRLFDLTPEQAVEATVGRGTCYNTQFAEMDEKAEKKHRRAIAFVLYGGIFPEDEPAEFTCSACGKTALIDWVTLYDIRFCPFCGAKVVDE